MRVLVVEDYLPLREALSHGLRASGFATDVAADGDAGLARAESGDYDVILLDVVLPGLDGLTILSRIRAQGVDSAVLVLTARDTIDDRVNGFQLGADDYMVKPFAFQELIARVHALVRRRYRKPAPEIVVGDLQVNTANHTVTRGGRPIELTAREYTLLELLALHAGQLVTRGTIWGHAWDSYSDVRSNVVDVYVGYLRRKLEAGGAPRLIHTKRGHGYVLSATRPSD